MTGQRLLLAVAIATSISLSMATIAKELLDQCRPNRAKVLCGTKDNPKSFAEVLRSGYDKIEDCTEHCPKVDITHVAATGFKKLPRYVERLAYHGYTYDIPVNGKDALSGDWCKLHNHTVDSIWPTFIGGIGDSGTRGAALLLRTGLDFAMCPGPDTGGCNKAGDNTIFFKLSGKEVLTSGNGDIQVDIDSDPKQTVAILAHICLGLNETMSRADKNFPGTVPGQWGWKSPRSLYYVAYMNRLLKGNFRMIHVIRDGRDVATGTNKMQFSGLCSKSFDGEEQCQQTPANMLRFWAKMNQQIYQYGIDVLGKGRYFPLRIEDFILGTQEAKIALITRLHKFLKIGTPLTVDTLNKTIAIGLGHEHSYGGHRFPEEERKEFLKQFSSEGAEQLKLFGYIPNDWGIEGDAVDLRAFSQ